MPGRKEKIYIHAYIHIYVHTYTHIHIHTNTYAGSWITAHDGRLSSLLLRIPRLRLVRGALVYVICVYLRVCLRAHSRCLSSLLLRIPRLRLVRGAPINARLYMCVCVCVCACMCVYVSGLIVSTSAIFYYAFLVFVIVDFPIYIKNIPIFHSS